MAKKFYTTSNAPVLKPEILSKETQTEKTGYIPVKKRVEDMILAGQRLTMARNEQYDTDTDEDLPIDPFRKPGLDMAEASDLINKAQNTLKQAKDTLTQGKGKKAPPEPSPAVTPPKTDTTPPPG